MIYPPNTIFKVHRLSKRAIQESPYLPKNQPLVRRHPLGQNGLSIEEHDQEGRVLRVDAGDFHLVNVYVPNSSGMKRLPIGKHGT